MSSSNIKEVGVRSVASPPLKESLSISTTNMGETFVVFYVRTVTHDWSDGSKATIEYKSSLTISENPQLRQLWDEMLSLLVDLGNGDNLGSDRDDNS